MIFKKIINWFKSLFKKERPVVQKEKKIKIESIKFSTYRKKVTVTINGVDINAEVTNQDNDEGHLYGFFAKGPGCYIVTLEENEFGIVDASIWTSRKNGGKYIGVNLWFESYGPGVEKGYLVYEKIAEDTGIKHNKRSIKFDGVMLAKTSRIINPDLVKVEPFVEKSYSIPVQFDLKW